MNNEFTVDEIKNSVEYQWRKWQTKLSLLIFLIILLIPFFIGVFFLIFYNDLEIFELVITEWISVSPLELILLSFSLYHYSKIRYLLKNYKKFNSYEVVLNQFSSSYLHRRSVYFTVTINYNGLSVKVETNPCFSTYFVSRFSLEDFINKKVVGLFDKDKGKFYIIKKVDTISIYSPQ